MRPACRPRRRGQRAQPRRQAGADLPVAGRSRPHGVPAHPGRLRFRSRRGGRGLCQGSSRRGPGGARHRQSRAAPRAGAAAAEAADAVHLHPRRAKVPGRSARLAAEAARDDKLLAALDADLRGLLAAWFDIGFLELQRIDWNSPAALLEKLVDYEAVHAIRSWRDLKNRLDSDRRCYAFFHPRMPRRAADLRRGRAGERPGRQRAGPARREGAGAGSARGRYRDLLLDQQLPARPGGDQLRQFPDQAGGRGTVGRVPQPEDVCDAVADSGFPPLAGPAAGQQTNRTC